MHRLQGEDSWLGSSGIQKREKLAKEIEEKAAAAETAAAKAEEERLALEAANMDRTRLGIFDPAVEIVEANQRRKEEGEKVENENTLDPWVGVFYRNKGEKKSSSSWFGWWGSNTGEQEKVEAKQSSASK
jgi:hypothetical protein